MASKGSDPVGISTSQFSTSKENTTTIRPVIIVNNEVSIKGMVQGSTPEGTANVGNKEAHQAAQKGRGAKE